MDMLDALDDETLGEMSRELEEDVLTYSDMLPVDVLLMEDEVADVNAELNDVVEPGYDTSPDELDAAIEVV
jgi:hypothetical protein